LRDFESYGERAANNEHKVRLLLQYVNELLAELGE
jgi:hypothetical protein